MTADTGTAETGTTGTGNTRQTRTRTPFATPQELRQPILLALLTAVLVAGTVLAAGLSSTPTYASTAVLSIDQPFALAASDDAGVIDKLSRLRFKYVGLIATDRVATPVAKRLALPVTEVRGRLQGSAQLQDLLLQATGTASSAAQARRTANALAAVLQAQVAAEQKALAIPADRQLQLVVVQPALSATQVAPSRARALALAVLAGLLIGSLSGAALFGVRRLRET